MLNDSHRLAIYVPGCLRDKRGKMAHGILRYSPHTITAVIDPDHVGQTTGPLLRGARHDAPIVADVDAALELGADVLVLGIAPLGGKIPPEWMPILEHAISRGMSIVNGLHDRLATRLTPSGPEQFIWDIRQEPQGLNSGQGACARLDNRRILMIGTDMSIGKMTAGLELYLAARDAGKNIAFVATGQIGITICGHGIPLDAIRVDYAAGAVEQAILAVKDADIVIVEGQGSLLHPSSSATLPLIRGTCPTDYIVCGRVGQTTLRDFPDVAIPPLPEFAALYQDLAACWGQRQRPNLLGFALNGDSADDVAIDAEAERLRQLTDRPAVDVIKDGPAALLAALD